MSLNFLGYFLYAQPAWYPNSEMEHYISSKASNARILADVYMLSNPMYDPNELIEYIQSKPKYFGKNGAVRLLQEI